LESLLELQKTFQKEIKAKRETKPSLEMESWPRMFLAKNIKSLLTVRRRPEDGGG